ncbi:MAG: hypothetical protein R2825_12915 [Saprospiraceae bacterium]
MVPPAGGGRCGCIRRLADNRGGVDGQPYRIGEVSIVVAVARTAERIGHGDTVTASTSLSRLLFGPFCPSPPCPNMGWYAIGGSGRRTVRNFSPLAGWHEMPVVSMPTGNWPMAATGKACGGRDAAERVRCCYCIVSCRQVAYTVPSLPPSIQTGNRSAERSPRWRESRLPY